MATVLTDNQHYSDIADAIRAKGVSGTFLPSEMADAIASITGGLYHVSGTVDYRGYNAAATFSVPYSRPERNVIVTAKLVGVWYKNADNQYELSASNDFSLSSLASPGPTVPMSFILLSPGVLLSNFTVKTKLGANRSIPRLNAAVITTNPYNASSNPTFATFASENMTFSGTMLSQVINAGHRFALTTFGTRYQYHIFAWGDNT